jgi:2',3'-cyclic-nucleotide 2'-phosphodiesterase (5'-nucleotidase family)
MAKVERLAGKKVHVGVGNFGGIRIDMPKGDIILDDMLSMFPFKN